MACKVVAVQPVWNCVQSTTLGGAVQKCYSPPLGSAATRWPPLSSYYINFVQSPYYPRLLHPYQRIATAAGGIDDLRNNSVNFFESTLKTEIKKNLQLANFKGIFNQKSMQFRKKSDEIIRARKHFFQNSKKNI